jgi:hypothetical protein
MSVHRVEMTLAKDGTLTLTNLPFHAGEAVEVLILPRLPKFSGQERYPLHGKPIQYLNPTEPVAEDEWAALR